MKFRYIAYASAVALLASVLGCAKAQTPVSFGVPSDRDVSIDDLVRALAQQGYQAAQVDEAAGVVYTDWEDTGFLYGEVDDEDATIVRRYIGTVEQTGSGARVGLRVDSHRCAPDRFDIDGYVLQGRCEEMDGLVSAHQNDLDELGERVRAALGS